MKNIHSKDGHRTDAVWFDLLGDAIVDKTDANQISTGDSMLYEPLSEEEMQSFSIRLAKAEYGLVINDFRRYEISKGLKNDEFVDVDLFGGVCVSKVKRYLQSSLIWVFALNEEPPRLTFAHVCELLDRDMRTFQRCTANALHDELVELVKAIRDTCGPKVARRAAEKVGEFINIDRLFEVAQ